MKFDKLRILLTIVVLFSLMISCKNTGSKNQKLTDVSESMLCPDGYFTEAEGKAFLEKQRQKYTTAEAWQKRSQQIRAQILKGSELEKFPEKYPLNPVFGEKRVYNGYNVQNVAFESLPGVYVTGSLFALTGVEGSLPGILSPHGHWSDPADYGRYKPDLQKRFAGMAKMGAMVYAYDMVGYGQLGLKYKT